MLDTIAAIATGGGVSAVGIIRISGDRAVAVAENIFHSSSGIKLNDVENRRLYYGGLYRTNNLIDLCLCMIARGPASYTGEDIVEFHCHGSPVILAEVLNTLFLYGVRQALPGEFTKRAFLNGRMDLTQVEAVIDLIDSETPAAAQNAAGQLHGAIGRIFENIYDKLLDIIAHFHVAIDYPDEDINDFEINTYTTVLLDIENEFRRMLETHERGKIVRDGISAVIIGRPNTGKSTLFNTLLGYERAIVTDIEGTTRDTIEEKILIGNILLRLTDTAGLRKSEDHIEILGVERTRSALHKAKLVILVLDGSQPLQCEDFDALHCISQDIAKIVVVNKSDLPPAIIPGELDALGISWCAVSALSGEGLGSLVAKIRNLFPELTISPSGELITNIRQANAISRAADAIHCAFVAISAMVTPDAVLTYIESALDIIGEITGKTVREDIITRIFERFCVGK